MKRLLGLITVVVLSVSAFGQSLLNATRGIPYPNDSTGTTLWGTAIITTAGAAETAPASAAGPVRIVVGGAGTSGNAVLASAGTLAPCTMDTAVTSAGNFFVISGAAGQCHPQSAAPASGTWVIGYLHDATTTLGGQSLVHVNGFFYGGTGTSGSGSGTVSAITSGQAGQLASYLPPWQASTNYSVVNTQIVDSNNNVQRVSTSGVSGTTAPTNWATTVGGTTPDGTGTLVWTMVGPGGLTTVGPSGIGRANLSAGWNFGTGLLQFGTSLTTQDVAIYRAGAGLLTVTNGTAVGDAGLSWWRSGNSCYLTADYSFTTSITGTCSRPFPAVARQWTVHCSLPITLTGTSGQAGTLVVGLNLSVAPTQQSMFIATYHNGSTIDSRNVPLSAASGVTQLLSENITDLSLVPANGVGVEFDGTIFASGTATTFFTYATVSAGSGAIKVGAYCRMD